MKRIIVRIIENIELSKIGSNFGQRLKLLSFFSILPILCRIEIKKIFKFNIKINNQIAEINIASDHSEFLIFKEIFLYEEYYIDINNPKNIIDLGANVGFSTVYLKLLYPESKIYSIEPDPENYNRLVENTKKLSGIFCFPIIISEQSGLTDFFKNSKKISGSVINRKGTVEQIKIEGKNFDDFIDHAKINDIDLIKCDVEGAEDFIINSKNFIKAKNIIAEFHTRLCSKDFEYRFKEISKQHTITRSSNKDKYLVKMQKNIPLDKKNNPLVSIVITLFNRSDCVLETLKSIINQTYKNIEIIIIDDNSQDDSYEKAINFLKKNNISFSIFKNKKNYGASYSRNFGINKSSGDFILIWDSDDILYKNAIYELIKIQINSDEQYGIISATGEYDKLGTKTQERYPEGLVERQEIINKKIPNNEKIRIFRREIVGNNLYESKNVDFIVNAKISRFAKWYHIDKFLGTIIFSPKSLTTLRKKFNYKIYIERANVYGTFIKNESKFLEENNPKYLSDCLYGFTLGNILDNKNIYKKYIPLILKRNFKIKFVILYLAPKYLSKKILKLMYYFRQ